MSTVHAAHAMPPGRRGAARRRLAAALLCWLGAAALAGAAEHRVVIDGMAFHPQVVHAAPGDTIVWVNQDLVVHNVTAASGGIRSGDLPPGRSWRSRVGQGSFGYICTLHPVMTGSVDVAPTPAQPRGASTRAAARPLLR